MRAPMPSKEGIYALKRGHMRAEAILIFIIQKKSSMPSKENINALKSVHIHPLKMAHKGKGHKLGFSSKMILTSVKAPPETH